MKNFKFFIILCLLLSSKFANAQGCLVNETVYTTKASGVVDNLLNLLGFPPGYSGPSEPRVGACVSNLQKVWTAGASDCRACPTGFRVELIGLNLVAVCDVTPTNGKVASSSIIYCNLDDYSLPLATAAGLFGIFVIRRRNKQ